MPACTFTIDKNLGLLVGAFEVNRYFFSLDFFSKCDGSPVPPYATVITRNIVQYIFGVPGMRQAHLLPGTPAISFFKLPAIIYSYHQSWRGFLCMSRTYQ